MANVIFRTGTKAQYDALETKNSSTLYWLHDVLELYKGDELYGKGAEATTLASGLMSAADKQKLDSLTTGTALSLTPVDASIVITDTEDGKLIGVQISKEEGNAVQILQDGLFVPVATVAIVPEYVIERQEVAEDGYSASYKLKRINGEEITYVGDVINIPRDIVLQSGSMKTITEENQPYEGAVIGDPYIDLVLNDEAGSHIYIPVKGLVDNYVSGDGIEIVDNTVAVKIDSANANGLVLGTDGIGLNLATDTVAGAMSPEHKILLDTLPDVYATKSDIEELEKAFQWGEM